MPGVCKLRKGCRYSPKFQLVFTSVFVTGDGTVGVGPVRWVIIGTNSATGFSAFLPFVNDALTAGRRMSYSHSPIPFASIVLSLANMPN